MCVRSLGLQLILSKIVGVTGTSKEKDTSLSLTTISKSSINFLCLSKIYAHYLSKYKLYYLGVDDKGLPVTSSFLFLCFCVLLSSFGAHS